MIERWRRLTVVIGAGGWLVASFDAGTGHVERLLLLVPLVLLPLLLGVLAAAAEPDGRIAAHLPQGVPSAPPGDRLGRATTLLGYGSVVACAPAALLTVLAVQAAPGGLAATATLPWLALTFVLAGRAALATARRLRQPAAAAAATTVGAVVVHLGAVVLLVGAGWFSLWAAGVGPAGTDRPTALLAATHLHHGGLVLTVVAGLLALRRPGAPAAAAAVGVAGGVPLIAVGIVAGPPWRWWAALVLSSAALAVAVLLGAEARARTGEARSWRVLQGGAALGLAVAMAVAAAHAASRLADRPLLDTATMATWHGTASAVVFGLLGALAWSDTRTDP